MKRFAAWAAFAALSLAAAGARANPKPLPFTYPFKTLNQGDGEIELYGDVTPLRALSTTTGDEVTYARTGFQVELEYGLLDHLELGLYVKFSPSPGEAYQQTATLDNGGQLKQRLRGRFAEEGEWPIDLSLYFEVVEALDEIELEAKINLAKRLDRVHLMANLSGELELYFDGHRDYVLNPSAGFAFEATPMLQPGIEYWTHVEFADVEGQELSTQQAHYVGPTFLLQLEHLWWSTGFYFRVDNIGEQRVPGESFGRVWARTLVGTGF